MSKTETYTTYLRVNELLQLQSPKSSPVEHDEMLFIIIHQVYELWFKQLLHELDYLSESLRQNDASQAGQTLKRMLTILKTIVSQVDILETMTPIGFNSFRTFLDAASGFQSVQFRELEFALGHKHANMLKHFPEGSVHHDELMARYHAPTLWDAFLAFLSANDFAVPQDMLERDVTQALEPSESVQQILIDIYKSNHPTVQICERLVDFDEGLQEWRYRHVKMVERTIGTKMGTGGSSGVKYLQSTIAPLFPDLWAIRSVL